jgi:hypothetical protein
LKKLTTKRGQSASIKIPKWKYADEIFVRPYLRARDTVTNLEFDVNGETDEEKLLQAESEHGGTRGADSCKCKNKFKNKIFRGKLKALGINMRQYPQY